ASARAGAGLLDGRRATTHWGWADHFAARFPDVQLDAAALYVEDGPCVTSAGVAAALDCCLYLVRRVAGEGPAAALARRIVMAPHRAGGQAQFIDQPLPRDQRADRFGRALDDIAAALAEDWPLDRAAALAGMTRRSFTRRLRDRTGSAFGDWMAERRVAAARNLLESTDLSIDHIAEATGLGSPANLRSQFARRVGIAPSRWRASFATRGGVG
ncbi:MAG: GlxA family transcriptional regulator, partial [Albidovulum sp.]